MSSTSMASMAYFGADGEGLFVIGCLRKNLWWRAEKCSANFEFDCNIGQIVSSQISQICGYNSDSIVVAENYAGVMSMMMMMMMIHLITLALDHSL
jgi:hypothetical protein